MKRIQIAQHVSFTPLIFLFFSTASIVIHIFLPIRLISHPTLNIILGIVCLGIAPLILLSAHTTRAVSSTQKGSQEGIVGSGLYKYSRHPQYVGYVLLMIGLAFVINSLIVMLAPMVAIIFFTLVIIPHQERLLAQQFPEKYDAYKKKVPMWM